MCGILYIGVFDPGDQIGKGDPMTAAEGFPLRMATPVLQTRLAIELGQHAPEMITAIGCVDLLRYSAIEPPGRIGVRCCWILRRQMRVERSR